MPDSERTFTPPPPDRPRHPQQEIADLLATALLRLRARHLSHVTDAGADSDSVGLGFCPPQRLNTNPDHSTGVRP